MTVVHFVRKKRPFANYSIEGLYKSIQEELKDKVNIEVVYCPFYSNGFFRRFLNCIYAAFKQKDVNHVTGDVNYLNLFFKKDKNIITILDCGLLNRTSGFKHWLAKKIWYEIPVKRAKYVVAISEATKNEILKYVKCDPEKIKVIYVPVSPVYKRFDKEFNKQNPVILHLGTAPNKNLPRLIKALNGITCKLVIIGKLKDEQLEALNENKIEYENYYDLTIEEVYEQYKRCDMLAFVSTYEGFGMPIVEANITGRPVITSDLLSMPEVAGNAALIIDPYNIDKIRNGILKIIDDNNFRVDLISNGFRNAERFNLKSIANQYLNLYLTVNN